jgi:hypothetical protein
MSTTSSARRCSIIADSIRSDFNSADHSIEFPSIDRKKESTNHGQPQLSQKETKHVRQLRIWMIVILSISAVTLGVITFWYLRSTEYQRFEDMFRDDALKLNQGLNSNTLNVFGSMDLLSTLLVAQAHSAGEKFPFTTLPHYANIASKILSMSAAISLWTDMLVDGIEQRLQWEEYAWERRSLVNETLTIMDTDPNFHGDIPWNVSMVESLQGDYDPILYNES